MNIDEIDSMASVCSEILKLHFSDHMDDHPYYHYGLEPSIDKFIDILNPFVDGIYGINLTDECIDIRYFVQCIDTLLITICNVRDHMRFRHLHIPYSVLEKGVGSIPNYLKEAEYQTLVGQIQVLVGRMRKDTEQMEILNKRIEQLVQDKWWVQ